jgi:hypothetical protein
MTQQIIDAFDTTAMDRIKTIEVGTMGNAVTVAGMDHRQSPAPGVSPAQ